MADLSQSNNPLGHDADDHLSRLLVDQVEDPFYKSLFQNIKDLINPPKLPPLELTSKPVAVKDIWGLYGRQKKSFAMSMSFQIGVVVLLFTVLSAKPVRDKMKQVATLVLPTDLLPPDAPPKQQVMKGGGGGGDRSLLPASKGRLPKAAVRQFVPPQAVQANLNAKMTMEPSILAPPDVVLPNVNMTQYGDPLGKIGPPSNGTGSGGGIGSGKGGGVGSGEGGGVGPGSGGGFGGGVFRVGGGVTAPVLVYKKEPEYSEEARKAKYQGTVTLYVEVAPNGKAQNIKVLHSLGLGLDEKAIEAVKQWTFKPGLKDGKPVTVAASIEVNFRLL
ncbi:MAG: energy transducer TonB [Candidatus Sulfopaludibacter sp.]|nr:energy transducer TonB [Candidatus Sulfopaludibacter sp.]